MLVLLTLLGCLVGGFYIIISSLIIGILVYHILQCIFSIFAVCVLGLRLALWIFETGCFLNKLWSILTYFSTPLPHIPLQIYVGLPIPESLGRFYSLNWVCSWLSPLFAKDLIFLVFAKSFVTQPSAFWLPNFLLLLSFLLLKIFFLWTYNFISWKINSLFALLMSF